LFTSAAYCAASACSVMWIEQMKQRTWSGK